MNKEFLMDYEAREVDEIKKFAQDFREGKIIYGNRYPQAHRLKLNDPYTKLIDGEALWSQIPLYGTTIIVLKPTKKEIFKKVHGFDVEDTERLVDFAKESGRIQFALDEPPTRYINLDFLEPLFIDLMPPKLAHIPLDCIISKEELDKSYDEINYLLENARSVDFIKKYAEKKYYKSTISSNKIKRGLIHDLIRLKLLGHENLVEDFIGWLTTVDAMDYILLLQMLHDIFLFPYDPLNGVISIKRPHMQVVNNQFSINSGAYRKIELPCEVGKFLNDKLNLISPKDPEGAIRLSDEYDLYDLRGEMNALNEAVEKEKIDVINEKSKEISLIFKNVWNEADTLKSKINMTRHGVSFGFGLVGVIATASIAGVGAGLLSGLGFLVVDKILDIKAWDPISEKIMKLGTQNQVVHAYDFRKKYNLF